MWDIINPFITKVTETVIDLIELGAVTSVGAVFFYALYSLVKFTRDKAKALVE